MGGGDPLGSKASFQKALVAVVLLVLFGGAGIGGLLSGNRALSLAGLAGLVVGAIVVNTVLRRRRLRAGEAIGLELVPPQVRRGERLDVRLRLPTGDPDSGDVELTLRCRVSYTVRELDSDGDSRRVTRRDTAWEQTFAASGSQPLQSVSFELPGHVPFSYAGKVLSFEWKLEAHQKVRRSTDRLREAPVVVLP